MIKATPSAWPLAPSEDTRFTNLMSLPSIAIRPSRAARSLSTAEVREQWVLRRVMLCWGLLVLNAATYFNGLSGIPMPGFVGKLITQGSLPVALFLALTVNRKIVLRPNIFLCLVGLLVLDTWLTIMQPQHIGTIYRTVRFTEFYVTLWLLTPWWGRRDMFLVRCHLNAYYWLLGSTTVGLFLFPSKALGSGRLVGSVWPIPAPQVAHYSATVCGIVAVLWLGGVMPGKKAGRIVALAMVLLILTHTRTALVAMIAGVIVAGMSLIAAKPRVRKFFATVGAVVGIAVITLGSFLATWLARGEGTSELENLTGRTKVWIPLLNFPRNKFQEIFGFGLSNSSFNGLAIDSNWLSSYQELGLWGDIVCGIILFFLIVVAYFQPRGVQRAIVLYIITYCLIASFTEDGFTDVSPYLLELTLAASLFVPQVLWNRRPGRRQQPDIAPLPELDAVS
jgi:hypothetical protein